MNGGQTKPRGDPRARRSWWWPLGPCLGLLVLGLLCGAAQGSNSLVSHGDSVETGRIFVMAASGQASPLPLLFSGGFETGAFTPWSQPQSSNYGYADNANVHFGPFNYDTQTVGQGTYSGRFDLPAWSGGRTRSQVITSRSVNTGGDDYYSLMFYVPVGWTPGASAFWGVSIAEFNFQNLGSGGPTIALQAHADHVTLVMQTGLTKTTAPAYRFRSNADSPGSSNLPPLYAIPPGMQQGAWHELIVHCLWATDRSGLVEVWHRIKGQTTWTKTASLSGYPTLQANPDGSYPATTFDTIQAYRGLSPAPVTVWLDGFSRSQSLAAAEGSLPSNLTAQSAKAVIKSVTFSGTPAKPTVTILGAGLKIPLADPPGSPSNTPLCPKTINGNAGLDFGTGFYLTAFADDKLKYAAGRYRPRVNELDCIGIVVLSHSTTKVQFALGAAYNQASFGYAHLVNGDLVKVVLNGAAYGLVVHYH